MFCSGMQSVKLCSMNKIKENEDN